MALVEPAQSVTWTYVDGDWHEGNVGVVGPRSHVMWGGLGAQACSTGARWFEGVAPDLDRHCHRVNAIRRWRSASSPPSRPTRWWR